MSRPCRQPGWTGTDLAEATETVTIAKGSTGDRSYTATWTIIPVEADIVRIFGKGRYATAYKNADKLKELKGVSKFDNIVVATVPETVAEYSGGVIGTDQNKLETALRTLWQDNNYRLKSSEHSFAITNLSNEVWRILLNLARVTPGENTAVNAFGGAVNNNDFMPIFY